MSANTVLLVLLGLGLGLVLGAAAVAIAVRGRTESAVAVAVAQHAAATQQLAALRAERDEVRQRQAAVEAELRELSARAAELGATLESERAGAQRRLSDLRVEQERLLEQFRAVSSQALSQNAEDFLRLADERFKTVQTAATAELDQRRQAVEHLVAPITESLGKVTEHLGTVEKDRTSSYAALREQVAAMGKSSEQLRLETAQLVTALRAPQVRGRWGELQLRRVVESAGMVEHCDFVEQASAQTDDGRLRPDLVVQLAGGKHVVVDSKVAFSGYLEAMEARNDTIRAARLGAHARHLRHHIDALAAKGYWQQFQPSPEFVVMFVPAEVFLNAALEQDPTLLEHAFERNVVIATPATLVALLRTVAYTWRQEALAANAQQVLSLGKELHGRLATMGSHLSKLGRQLNGTVKSYNDTVSSLESRVLVSARRMVELNVVDAVLDCPAQVELVAREVQAGELAASVEQSLVPLAEMVTDSRFGMPRPPADPGPDPRAAGGPVGA